MFNYNDDNIQEFQRKDLLLLKKYVTEILIIDKELSEETAQRMVEESTFNEMLFERPRFVMHFSAKYWAEDILEEFSVLN